MSFGGPVSDGVKWVQVHGDCKIHPYGMHKLVNLSETEVLNCVSTDENHPRRWVLLRDGEYQVWVRVRNEEEYGYELQDDEKVSEEERAAIMLKQRAIRDGGSVTLEEVAKCAEHEDPDVLGHALIAGYYAAKANPKVLDTEIDELREKVREKTGHVDLDHTPTVMNILQDVTEEHG